MAGPTSPGITQALDIKASMRGRAERLGGRLTILSSPGGGTTVSLQMPLRRPWERMTMFLSRRLR